MLTVSNLTKAYGEQVVLEDTGFAMSSGERLGLVGRNGHGKTTLFRLLIGTEHPDAGTIVTPRGYRIGHLSQHLEFHEANILDEVCTVLGDRRDTDGWRAEAALMGLGFGLDELGLPASHFSGGFQIRVNLARVLVDQPDLLLLDEPTNYLDITSVRWLERFLRGWPGELIVITHDRRFLEKVTTHSMVVHRKQLRRMPGTVEKLVEQIATEEAVYENTRLNDEKKRRQEERFIERFRSKASKASVVQSRMKALEKRGRMEALDRESDLAFRFRPAPFHTSGMLAVEDLSFGYPDGPRLIEGLSFGIDHGDRVAIIGPNGKGKSTLLNLLAGELQPDGGRIKSSPTVRSALFGQTNVDRLHRDNTIEQELMAADPDQTRTQVRGLAGLLMFPGDLATKPISVLSGGERSRVLLGKLLVEPSNLLLLDEPTSHLDLESVEGLLRAVDEFPGAVILVTHDEAILERMATRLVVFDGGRVFTFESGYRDFLDRVGWCSEADERGGGGPTRGGEGGAPKAQPEPAAVRAPARPRRDPKELRRLRAEIVQARGKLTKPLQRKVDTLERDIEKLEAAVAQLDADMAAAAEAGRTEELTRLAAAAKRKRGAIDTAFDALQTAHDELERVRADYDARLAELS